VQQRREAFRSWTRASLLPPHRVASGQARLVVPPGLGRLRTVDRRLVQIRRDADGVARRGHRGRAAIRCRYVISGRRGEVLGFMVVSLTVSTRRVRLVQVRQLSSGELQNERSLKAAAEFRVINFF
jgi:hypothetical protein